MPRVIKVTLVQRAHSGVKETLAGEVKWVIGDRGARKGRWDPWVRNHHVHHVQSITRQKLEMLVRLPFL